MSDFNEKAQQIADLANIVASIATGAGIPLIQLGVTIASNFAKGKDITQEDIAASKAKAKSSLAELRQAIDNAE